MMRAALFTATGVLWCAHSLLFLTNPNYQDPVSAADWFTVLSFSAALFALAVALPVLAQLIGRRDVFRVSLVPAAGAALAGVGKFLEDGLQPDWVFWAFALGGGLVMFGLVAFTVVVVVAGRGRLRLLAAVPVAQLIGMLLLQKEPAIGVLILAAWLMAGALTLGLPTRMAAPSKPTSP